MFLFLPAHHLLALPLFVIFDVSGEMIGGAAVRVAVRFFFVFFFEHVLLMFILR